MFSLFCWGYNLTLITRCSCVLSARWMSLYFGFMNFRFQEERTSTLFGKSWYLFSACSWITIKHYLLTSKMLRGSHDTFQLHLSSACYSPSLVHYFITMHIRMRFVMLWIGLSQVGHDMEVGRRYLVLGGSPKRRWCPIFQGLQSRFRS